MSKSYEGCDSTTILNLHVSQPPQQINMSKTICEGDAYVLPWDSTVTTAGTYVYHHTNVNGCDSLVENVTVIDSACPLYLYMPTAFTPNKDHHNDIFKPLFSGHIADYRLSIYNRWGKLIFSSTNLSAGWDGTVQGIEQPLGTYVWICSYSLYRKPFRTEKGTVTLVR